jgi:hypothetical protein
MCGYEYSVGSSMTLSIMKFNIIMLRTTIKTLTLSIQTIMLNVIYA